MRPEPACDGIYGVVGGDTCEVNCAENPDLTETWECIGNETWERKSDAVECSSSGSTLCSYPMWTIPGTGTDERCDFDECPMRPEPACDGIYGVVGGDTCEVNCAENPDLTETWECIGNETWERKSDAVECSSSDSNF